jgi:penicillin-binding protein 1A
VLRAIVSFFGFIFSWLTIGSIMIILGIGAIFWMYGRELPNHAELKNYEPKTISYIYSGEGRLMDEFANERRIFTAIEEVPLVIQQAFVSAEDKNFYTHPGYDPVGIAKAAFDAARGERLRGASTIPQQVVKNIFLSADRSAERKIKEIILASRLAETLTKDKILEIYLNEIFLGQNSYGVTAAAQTYFNKTLGEITIAEAAYLASLPKKPSELHPVRHKEVAISRRNFVLKEMMENGYLSQKEAEEASAEDLQTVQAGDFAHYKADFPARDYFTDEIRRQLSQDFGEEEFFGGGLAIRATVDPEMQKKAAEALRRGLETYDRKQGFYRGAWARIDAVDLDDEAGWRTALRAIKMPRDIAGWHSAVVLELTDKTARIGIEGFDGTDHVIPVKDLTWAKPVLEDGTAGKKAKKPSDLLSVGNVIHVMKFTPEDEDEAPFWSLRQVPEIQGAFMAMDTQTGRVIAMQGGFSYQHSVFNRATQATRQPGSSFKPFVYAAALDSGYTPATIVIDAPVEVKTPQGIWRPRNSSRKFYGPTPLRTGIEWSRNLMTIRLAQEIGMDTVANYAERFGVYDDMQEHIANSLGAQETTLFNMVAAYGMFANGGERVVPTLVDRVQSRRGETLYRHDRRNCRDCDNVDLAEGQAPRIVTNRSQVMDAFTAYQLTSMMRGVVERGTASRHVNLGVPVAGKTGTTNEARDVWFVGFTPNIVAGCYMGFDRPAPLGRGSSGGAMCGPVFQEFMAEAIKEFGASKFAVPEGGVFVKIDRYSGARVPNDESGAHVVAELFREGEEPVFGTLSIIDGGYSVGSDLPMFGRDDEGEEGDESEIVVTSTGETKTIPKRATFGALSSGGLY